MSSYQDKILQVRSWIEDVIETVKKDLKNEHLKIDPAFCRRHFLGKHYTEVDINMLATAYLKEIQGGNVGLAEFIATRWLLKNSDIYGFFEEQLKNINPDFEAIKEISAADTARIIDTAVNLFGAVKSYIFSVFNEVAFTAAVFEKLGEAALQESSKQRKEYEERQEKLSIYEMQKRHEREMHAMKDRYEKKLSGLQRKYIHDTDLLKKRLQKSTHGG